MCQLSDFLSFSLVCGARAQTQIIMFEQSSDNDVVLTHKIANIVMIIFYKT